MEIRLKTLGFILVFIGLIGGVVAYVSGIMTEAVHFYKMGVGANIVQMFGLIGIFIDKD